MRPSSLQIGTPLLGRLPLDPELAKLCDSGGIEDYGGDAFADVAERVVTLMPAGKAKPVFE